MQTQKYTRIIGGLDNPSDITISPEEGYKYVAGEKIQYNSDIHLCNFEKLHDCNGDSKYLRPLSNPELQQLQNIIRLSTSWESLYKVFIEFSLFFNSVLRDKYIIIDVHCIVPQCILDLV